MEGSFKRTTPATAPAPQETGDRRPYLTVLRSCEKPPTRLPSPARRGREAAGGAAQRAGVAPPLPLPLAEPQSPHLPRRASRVRAPPSPAGRARPPDTHLGRSGGWGPSRATRRRSRCGRQRAHAASTAAGRTRRHCPCCGASARGLPRPHRAGALPAAPFRLRRTILRGLRAARRCRPLTACVCRAAP